MEFRMYKNFNDKLPFSRNPFQKSESPTPKPLIYPKTEFSIPPPETQFYQPNPVPPTSNLIASNLLGNQKLQARSDFVKDYQTPQIFSKAGENNYHVGERDISVNKKHNLKFENQERLQYPNLLNAQRENKENFGNTINQRMVKKNDFFERNGVNNNTREYDSLQNFMIHQNNSKPSNLVPPKNFNSIQNDYANQQIISNQPPNFQNTAQINISRGKPDNLNNFSRANQIQTPNQLYSNGRRAVSRQSRKRMAGSSYSLGVKQAENRFLPSKNVFQQSGKQFLARQQSSLPEVFGGGVGSYNSVPYPKREIKKEELQDQELNQLLLKYQHKL